MVNINDLLFFSSKLYYFHYDSVYPASSHLGYLTCFTHDIF